MTPRNRAGISLWETACCEHCGLEYELYSASRPCPHCTKRSSGPKLLVPMDDPLVEDKQWPRYADGELDGAMILYRMIKRLDDADMKVTGSLLNKLQFEILDEHITRGDAEHDGWAAHLENILNAD